MIVDSMDRKTKTIKESMGWFNEKRLYWVWASSLLKVILAALPDDFFNVGQATEVVKAPDPYTGTLSWALYYFRFSLNMFLLLKHTISGPWMSEREKRHHGQNDSSPNGIKENSPCSMIPSGQQEI